MFQLFLGLKYLANEKVIHYDLKPGNLLIVNGSLKITDFGLAKELARDETQIDLTSQGAGTYYYLPPECLRADQPSRISAKVDVWSAGVIFYQLLYGKKPFGEGQSQAQMAREEHNYRPAFPETPKVSDEAKELIRHCLTVEVLDRPTAEQCLNDTYFVQMPKMRKKSNSGVE
jgi:tousled-like kinase